MAASPLCRLPELPAEVFRQLPKIKGFGVLLTVDAPAFRLNRPLAISRRSRVVARALTVRFAWAGLTGSGESVPNGRYGVMVGCRVGMLLPMAPAVLLAQGADYVDLDGPLLLAEDRDNALHYDEAGVHPPGAALWG